MSKICQMQNKACLAIFLTLWLGYINMQWPQNMFWHWSTSTSALIKQIFQKQSLLGFKWKHLHIDAFIQSNSHCIQDKTFLSSCTSWKLNPWPWHCYGCALLFELQKCSFIYLFLQNTVLCSVTNIYGQHIFLIYPFTQFTQFITR